MGVKRTFIYRRWGLISKEMFIVRQTITLRQTLNIKTDVKNNINIRTYIVKTDLFKDRNTETNKSSTIETWAIVGKPPFRQFRGLVGIALSFST